MQNQSMKRKLEKGECVDISDCLENADGDRILKDFEDNKDYCIGVTESWIWSIGRHHKTGQILASTSSKFYQNPEYECLFLR